LGKRALKEIYEKYRMRVCKENRKWGIKYFSRQQTEATTNNKYINDSDYVISNCGDKIVKQQKNQ
jgi:hypothetical protein